MRCPLPKALHQLFLQRKSAVQPQELCLGKRLQAWLVRARGLQHTPRQHCFANWLRQGREHLLWRHLLGSHELLLVLQPTGNRIGKLLLLHQSLPETLRPRSRTSNMIKFHDRLGTGTCHNGCPRSCCTGCASALKAKPKTKTIKHDKSTLP